MSLQRAWGALVGGLVALTLSLGPVVAVNADDAVEAARQELSELELSAIEVQKGLSQSRLDQESAQREYEVTSADLEIQADLVEEIQVQVGRVAVVSHQQGAGVGAAALFFSSDSEEDFLANIAVMQSVESITDERLTRLAAEQTRLVELEASLSETLGRVQTEIEEQSKLDEEYQAKIAASIEVVNKLTGSQRAALETLRNEDIIAANKDLLENALIEGNRYPNPGATPESGSGVWPAEGPITSPYGFRVNPIGGHSELHDGTDIGASCGTPVRASWSGTVLSAAVDGGWGNRIIVDSGTYKAAYNHLETMAVSGGQTVEAGQVIASVGTTGYSTGCHLHFSTWVNGEITDPQTLF